MGDDMPSGSYLQVYVKCPFYVSDNGKDTIICEGIIPGSNDHCVYKSQQDFKKQITVFCCEHYTKCERNCALTSRYEETEQD